MIIYIHDMLNNYKRKVLLQAFLYYLKRNWLPVRWFLAKAKDERRVNALSNNGLTTLRTLFSQPLVHL